MAMPRTYTRLDMQPTRKVLLQFGATLLGASLIGAAVMRWWMHEPDTAKLLVAFGLTMSIGATVPGLGRALYVAWMALGLTLGWITSPVILAGVYFLVITPIGIALRLLGHDSMQQKPAAHAESYWRAYPEHDDPARYLGQF